MGDLDAYAKKVLDVSDYRFHCGISSAIALVIIVLHVGVPPSKHAVLHALVLPGCSGSSRAQDFNKKGAAAIVTHQQSAAAA